MHRMKTTIKARVGLLAGIAALVAAVALLPVFGGRTAYAAGLDLDGTASLWQFTIPGVPVSTLQESAVQANVSQVGPDEWEVWPKKAGFSYDRLEGRIKPDIPPLGSVNTSCKVPFMLPVLSEVKDAGPPPLISVEYPAKCVGPTNIQFLLPGYSVWPKAEVINTTGLKSNQQAPFKLGLTDNVDELFPKTGELLLGKTELVVYDNNDAAPECGSRTAFQVCITQRAKVGEKKAHGPGTQVKLATQLTKKITMPASGPKTDALAANAGASSTLNTEITKADTPPFNMGIVNGGNFPNKGFITVSHQDVDIGTNVATEYFQYNNNPLNPCGKPEPAAGASELCIVARALQPDNEAYQHPADGYPQPGKQPGRSKVDLHFQLQVKSNAGFFPAGNLIVYEVGPGNIIVNAELLGHNNAAGKIKAPAAQEFHITERGAPASTFKKTDIQQHAVGSIVTGPDTYVVCRVGHIQPGVIPEPVAPTTDNDGITAVPGTSVAAYPVCYSQSQPNDPPKTKVPKELLVPIVGQPWIAQHALSQPFLSTGGYANLLYGPVKYVDANGTSDGVLKLISPCVTDFTPGVNLLMEVILQVDKDWTSVDIGDIRVVMDTIPEGPGSTHVACDDPAAWAGMTSTAYIYSGDANKSDDDTDKDGCVDSRELSPDKGTGGLRDPWNPYDFYDVNHDGAIGVFDDIIEVSSRFGVIGNGPKGKGDPHDRGPSYGPFDHNRSQPDKVINMFDDILVVANQFGDACPHNHANYPGNNGTPYGPHP